MQTLIQFITDNKVIILGVLFALSEGLALIPAVKANSVFELFFGWLKKQQPQVK